MSNGKAGGPIEAETLAAYIDGTLPPDERARVDAVLAEDSDSYQWLLDSLRAMAAAEETQAPAVAPDRVSSRRSLTVLAGLAAAAAVVLAVWFGPQWLDRVTGTTTRPSVVALVDAVGDARYIEARLTGGFRFGPRRPASRGSLGDQSIALLAAAAPLQQAATTTPTARTLHDWGVAQVLMGNLDDGIQTLEEAVLEAPTDAGLLSDLGAAYAARAASAQDWSKALEYSERALRIHGELLEAQFNRALALEALHLDGARAAWQAYLDRDGSSPWAQEARDRLERLLAMPQGSIRPSSDAAIRAALDTGTDAAALARAVQSDPRRTREWLEEELPRQWAVAVRDGDGAGEIGARGRAARLIAAYKAVSQDAFPSAATQYLWSRVTDRPAVARAVLQFVDAANLVRDDRLPEASALVEQALPILRTSASPLEGWARYFVVLDRLQQGRLAESGPELDRLQASADRQGFSTLSGVIRNQRGRIFGRQGNQEGAIRERVEAIPYFERAGDRDQVAVMYAQISEAYRLIGDITAAWANHGQALELLAVSPDYRSRHLILVQAGLTSTFEGHYEAALAFQREVIENGRQWQRASGIATGLLHVARNAFRAQRLDEADAAIRDARQVAAQVTEPTFRNSLELELLEAEGEVIGRREPAVALPMLAVAIEQFSKAGFGVRRSRLLLARGRLYSRSGDTAAAERDWQQAVDVLEQERATVSTESLRLAQAGSLRALQTEIALSRFQHGRDAAESLEPVERSRARTLVEAALGATIPVTAIRQLQSRLDDRTGVLYYAVGDRQAVGWLLTTHGATATALPVDPKRLAALIDRHRRAFAGAASREALLQSSRDLYRVLVEPLAAGVAGLASLVIAPDPALAGVSFGALNNPADGRYLIETFAVAMAPSGALITQPAAQHRRVGVLLVGADRPSGLPALPWARVEISRLSQLYDSATVLSGADATRERFLTEGSRASVIHFAGHAVASPANPLLSRLMLHGGADGRSDLYAYELSALDVASSVVVLAACQTGYAGIGVSDDDGVLAMARPFLARGARAVVATYRDVSDRGSPELMTQFHRHLKDGLPPSEAWQATAVGALRLPNATADWMDYAVFLGRGSLPAVRAPRLTEDSFSGGRP